MKRGPFYYDGKNAGAFQETKRQGAFLCDKTGLGEFFEIPEEVETIYVKLSKRASKGAYKVVYHDGWDTFITNSEGVEEKRLLAFDTDRVMQRFGSPFYASVEY